MRILAAVLLLLLALVPVTCTADSHEDQLLLDVQPLISQYAPHVDRVTLTSIIAVESSGWPWTIRDDTDLSEPPLYLPSYDDAVHVAERLVSIGHNLDLGVAQINTSNLASIRMSVRDVLVPANNLQAAQFILELARKTVVHEHGEAWLRANATAALVEIEGGKHGGLSARAAREAVVVSHGIDWIHSHPVDAARREVQLYHANTSSPTYLSAILGIAPHVSQLLSPTQIGAVTP
jgi:hypothetical protein